MATQSSDLIATGLLSPPKLNNKDVEGAEMRFDEWSLTGVNGVDGEIYNIASVERNERVISRLCRLNIPAQGAARLVQMGFAEHKNAVGDTVVADPDAFFSALDVATAKDGLIDGLTVTGLVESILFAGKATITLTITGDTAVAGAFAGNIVTGSA